MMEAPKDIGRIAGFTRKQESDLQKMIELCVLGCSELNKKRGLIARMCVTAYFVRFEFLAEARKLRGCGAQNIGTNTDNCHTMHESQAMNTL